jgi:predicted ester cyclase
LSQPELGAFGIPATGRAAKWSGISLYHLTDGRITSSRSYSNGYALLRQLGLVTGLTPPTSPPAGGVR